jgi:hypothetical protein
MPTKRSSYLQLDQEISLDKTGLRVWGYDQNEKFVCRLEINHAGVAVYAGTGQKLVANIGWEALVEKLAKPKKTKVS